MNLSFEHLFEEQKGSGINLEDGLYSGLVDFAVAITLLISSSLA